MLSHKARRCVLRKACFVAAGVVFTCLGTSLVFGQSASPAPQAPENLRVQEDNTREAIFRYRIGQGQSASPVFLSINGEDPTNEFMARFSNSKLKVKKASGSYFKKDPFPGHLRDRTTGREAMEFLVGPIRWITSTTVEVKGGMYCGGLCADAGTYQVTKRSDRWTVEKYDVKMIS